MFSWLIFDPIIDIEWLRGALDFNLRFISKKAARSPHSHLAPKRADTTQHSSSSIVPYKLGRSQTAIRPNASAYYDLTSEKGLVRLEVVSENARLNLQDSTMELMFVQVEYVPSPKFHSTGRDPETYWKQ